MLPGTTLTHAIPAGTFEDDSPFPKLQYASFVEGTHDDSCLPSKSYTRFTSQKKKTLTAVFQQRLEDWKTFSVLKAPSIFSGVQL